MLEVLIFSFSSFWNWAGMLIYLVVIIGGISTIFHK